jgi:CRISPR-associated exonuclease Cas4
MPFSEDDLLPISALQHLEFCPRRCALIHVEGIWSENLQTAEGRLLHQRVHEAPSETLDGVRIVRGLRLASREWGLFGVADIVEFHPLAEPATAGVTLPGAQGGWRPFPVEYKRGRRKPEMSYLVQLCAQALCLEEMLQTEVPQGALYHGKSRRRQPVAFEPALRGRTQQLAAELHRLIDARQTPPAVFGPKCKFCSLVGACEPRLLLSHSARAYVERQIRAMLEE